MENQRNKKVLNTINNISQRIDVGFLYAKEIRKGMTRQKKIRLSETGLIKLNAVPKESGRSIKPYLRSLINKIVPYNKPNLEYLEILSELRLICSNMNQIALIANKSSYIDYK